MKHFNKNFLFFLVLFFFLAPTIVMANAGSPMMWFGIIHTLFLNALIGLIESSILKHYMIPNRFWLIIIANYISMFFGLYFIAPYFSTISGNNDFWGGQSSIDDYNLLGFFIGMISSYIATLLIEFPFFYWAVKDKLKLQSLIHPFIIANTTTNIVMLIVYLFIIFQGHILIKLIF